MTTISEHDIQACPLKSRLGAPKAQDYSDAILTLSFNLLSPEDQRQVMAKCMPGVAFRSTVNSRDVTFNVSYALHALHRWAFMSDAFGKLIRLAASKRFRWIRFHPEGAALQGWELHELKSVRSVGWSLARPLVRLLFWIVDGAWLGMRVWAYRRRTGKLDEAQVEISVPSDVVWRLYESHVLRVLTRDGMSTADAMLAVQERRVCAIQALQGLLQEVVPSYDTRHIQKV